jgi:beta-glucanase (GH16 family)
MSVTHQPVAPVVRRTGRLRAALLSAVVVLLVGGVLVATGVTTPSVAPVLGGPCGGSELLKSDGSPWSCTFDDEFDGSELNRALWQPQTTAASGFTSGPAAYRTCFTDDPANISVADGILQLTARQEPDPMTCADRVHGAFTTQYTSGEVTTRTTFSQTYGRFEVRAKLPQTTVKGLQETLWLWPENDLKYGAWPRSGEIDFGEFYSKYYYVDIPYIHYVLDPTTVDTLADVNIYTSYSCHLDYTAFNTYAVEWLPGLITILLNDKPCIIDNYRPANVDAPAPFSDPFYLALTQAFGISINGNDNAFDPAVTPLPASTMIDYVRVWK